ncbi:MAG: bifunctional nuclease family protein [Calditerrivibrio sp.]|nr:bifunctional nuclease family protein [Calditerrivibrio sp.]
MIQFKVRTVIKNPLLSCYNVILQSLDENIILPLPVGPFEAEAIYTVLASLNFPRPMVYDFMKNVLLNLGDVSTNRMVIYAFSDGVFHARMELEHSGNLVTIECRPSDGIALSLRTDTPIFVEDEVVDKKKCIFKDCLNENEKEFLEHIIVDQELKYT